MKFNLKKDVAIMIIALLPLIYLSIIWKALPGHVPLHWNINGEADKTGSKYMLFVLPSLPILTYLVFLGVPLIDPKRRLQNMGNKLQRLKFILTLFMAVLATYILYCTKIGTLTSPNTVTILAGILFMVFGNYFKTIKPNYFIGIRTPWALNDDHNWKMTHKLAGKLWLIGGLTVIIAGFILSSRVNIKVLLTVLAIMILIPFIYSYKIYSDTRKAV